MKLYVADKEIEKIVEFLNKNSIIKIINKNSIYNNIQDEYIGTRKKLITNINNILSKHIDLLSNFRNYSYTIENYNQKYISENFSKIQYPEFEKFIEEPEPTYNEVIKKLNVPKKKILAEFISKPIKEARLQRESEAQEELNKSLDNYKAIQEKRYQEYLYSKSNYEENINNFKKEINNAKNGFSNRHPVYTMFFLKDYLQKIHNKIDIDFNLDMFYNKKINSLVIEYEYMNIADIVPKIKCVVYDEIKDNAKIIYYNNTEYYNLYSNYIFQFTLKLIDIALKFNNYTYANIIFNGYVSILDKATGNPYKTPILSVQSNLEKLNGINMKNVVAKDCLYSWGMIFSPSFNPVQTLDKVSNNYLSLDNSSEKDLSKKILTSIDYSIDGFMFEKFSKDLLEANGFTNVSVTQASGDYGADVIATKNDIKYAIQCKKYSSPVGVKAIQEVMGSKSIYDCHVAAVLTNNTFTPNAIKLAHQNNVLLWDRDKLKEYISNFNSEISEDFECNESQDSNLIEDISENVVERIPAILDNTSSKIKFVYSKETSANTSNNNSNNSKRKEDFEKSLHKENTFIIWGSLIFFIYIIMASSIIKESGFIVCFIITIVLAITIILGYFVTKKIEDFISKSKQDVAIQSDNNNLQATNNKISEQENDSSSVK